MTVLALDTSDREAMNGLTSALLRHIGNGDRCRCGMQFELPLFPQPADYEPVAQHLRDAVLDELRAKSVVNA